jgi:hypothetical protein
MKITRIRPYGNYLRETGYALKKLNVELHDVSAATV